MGRLGGKVVFVPRVLPGEGVRVLLRREKKNYAEALPQEILKASSLRQLALCPLFGLCGGCDFQHIPYAEQVEIKREIFRETFRRIGHRETDGLPVEESPAFGYRSRVQVHRAEDADREISPWGFKKAGEAGVVPVRQCPVAAPEINAFLAEARAAAHCGEKLSVFGWGGEAFYRPGDEPRLEVLGRELVFSPRCFFQNNIGMLEKLVSRAFHGLCGDYALDLYGGVGTFGVFLAEKFRKVLCVEESPLSAAYARRNLRARGGEVFCGSAENYASRAAGAPDLIVVDPPRTGLSPVVRAFLKKSGPPLILYASCDTGTLARDAAFLLQNGYNLAEVRIFDFYPQTAHIESLCRFTRA